MRELIALPESCISFIETTVQLRERNILPSHPSPHASSGTKKDASIIYNSRGSFSVNNTGAAFCLRQLKRKQLPFVSPPPT